MDRGPIPKKPRKRKENSLTERDNQQELSNENGKNERTMKASIKRQKRENDILAEENGRQKREILVRDAENSMQRNNIQVLAAVVSMQRNNIQVLAAEKNRLADENNRLRSEIQRLHEIVRPSRVIAGCHSSNIQLAEQAEHVLRGDEMSSPLPPSHPSSTLYARGFQ